MATNWTERAAAAAFVVFAACHPSGARTGDVARPPGLRSDEIAALIDPDVPERGAWADAIAAALTANAVPLDAHNACSVIAIIGQESSFEANPVVPRLAAIVAARIDRARDRLGPLGGPIVDRLLAGHSPDDPRSFAQRLARVRTERDVDLAFRDVLAYHRAHHPTILRAAGLAGKLFDVDALDDLNPITTAGSMQVSVRFAELWAREHGRAPETARDALYTREGGVLYGTARLFGHPARYAEPRFRFADYNAGVYTSRNAAFQTQLARLLGESLTPDGDLLAYDRDGDPTGDDSLSLRALLTFRRRLAPDLSERRVREDARKEKTLAFEHTDTYRAVGRAYAGRFGQPAVYAVLPDVEIESPKLRGKRSTAWFARSVERRFDACMRR